MQADQGNSRHNRARPRPRKKGFHGKRTAAIPSFRAIVTEGTKKAPTGNSHGCNTSKGNPCKEELQRSHVLSAYGNLSVHHVRIRPAAASGTAHAPWHESHRHLLWRTLWLDLHRDRVAFPCRPSGPHAHRWLQANDAAEQELWRSCRADDVLHLRILRNSAQPSATMACPDSSRCGLSLAIL